MTASPNPAKNTSEPDPALLSILREACREAGLSAAGARVIHHYANIVVLLPEPNVVARISLNNPPERAQTSVAVTRWLTDHQAFPATAPIPGTATVVLGETTAVTFWQYYPQPDAQSGLDSASLARLLRHLHALPSPPVDLPRWDPLQSLRSLVHGEVGAAALTATERQWLLERITEVREAAITMDSELGWGHVHGDAWAGNLLWDRRPSATATSNVLLGDWDSVCYGPREIDLIPSWHAEIRYGKGPAWSRAFALAYGHDLSRSPGFRTLFALRDLVQLAGPLRRADHSPVFAEALRQRMAGIKSDDDKQWREF